MFDERRRVEEMSDRRTGRLMAMYANAHRDEQKRREPFTEEDFIPQKVVKKAVGFAPKEHRNFFRLLAAIWGGKFTEKNG